jgi:hypothetical protein
MEVSNLENLRKQLLRVNGQVDGQNSWILIDCGATENFVSQGFVQQHRLKTRSVGSLAVQLPDGRDKGISKAVIIEELKFPHHTFEKVVTYVMPLQQYDLILGKPWLSDINSQVDWQSNTLVFENGRKLVANELVPKRTNKCNSILISKHQITRTPKNAELYTVYLASQETTDETKLIPEAEQILDEFADVFPTTLPDKLPPQRKLDHAIDLVPGATPPHRPIYRYRNRK